MEVGQAATYVDLAGQTHDCLVAKIVNGKASIVIVHATAAEDHFGRPRAELGGVKIGKGLGAVRDLVAKKTKPKKTKPKKKTTKKKTKKKTTKKKAGA